MAEKSKTEQAREAAVAAKTAYEHHHQRADDPVFTGQLIKAIDLLADEIDELKARKNRA